MQGAADHLRLLRAISLYSYGCTYDDIALTLSVGKAKVSDWLSRTVKEQKAKRDEKIFEMWLACYTQDEIAEAAGCSRPNVEVLIKEFQETKLSKADQSSAAHATDFDPPVYNVWKQQEKTPGANHFGNSEVRWLDNLLYLYTEPFEARSPV